MSNDRECWLEALRIEAQHGANARHWVARQMSAVAMTGKPDELARIFAVAARLDSLRSSGAK